MDTEDVTRLDRLALVLNSQAQQIELTLAGLVEQERRIHEALGQLKNERRTVLSRGGVIDAASSTGMDHAWLSWADQADGKFRVELAKLRAQKEPVLERMRAIQMKREGLKDISKKARTHIQATRQKRESEEVLSLLTLNQSCDPSL